MERSDLRPASVEFKRRACSLFVEWFGDMPVGRVLPATAESYRAMLSKTGRSPQGRSQVSVKGYLENFKPFWRWLRNNDFIDRDPFVHVAVKVDERPREGFTSADIGLLMMASGSLQRIQNCLGLLGCRRGEMLNIQLRDVHLDHARPHIELVSKRQADRTWPWGTKNHQAGLVAVPERMQFDGVTVELRELIRRRADKLNREPQAYLCVPKQYVEQMLWIQVQGRLTWGRIKDPTGNFARSFRRLQRRAGIAHPCRFHELRAAFVTGMLDAGIPATRVAKAVRHANIKTTMRYDRKSELSLIADVAQAVERAYMARET